MYHTDLAVLCVLLVFSAAYAVRVKGRADASDTRVLDAQRRERDLLEAVRVLVAASRESSEAVLAALDGALRSLNPLVDDVLVFEPAGDELHCIFAAGPRCEHFRHFRMRRDHPTLLPAHASLCAHRVELAGANSAVIPTDRAAVAVPMLDDSRIAAVVYASTAHSAIRDVDVLVRVVAQAASPYALACEREADRARATFDALTGLHTPRAFREQLQQRIGHAQLQEHAALSLWFIDTDRFKDVNDRFGHATGDVVLQRMAALLRQYTLTGVDLPARNGGDEFCAILAHTHKVAAIERAQQFCQAVHACDFGVGLPVTASVGVAAYPYDASEANELLEIADAAMYHSKRAGRGCVSFAVKGAGFAVYR